MYCRAQFSPCAEGAGQNRLGKCSSGYRLVSVELKLAAWTRVPGDATASKDGSMDDG